MTSARRRDIPLSRRLLDIYQRLFDQYGPQHWWPSDGAFETIVGAILTQNTAWKNVERALNNLKAAGVLDPAKLCFLSQEDVAMLVRPSGYFNTKAKKLKAFVHYLEERYQGNLDALLSQDPATLRAELLSIYGIGPETADDILLYAGHAPCFVVDAYTKGIFRRLHIAPSKDSYGAFQALFQEHLPRDTALFNEYHALLDRHAKERCRKVPLCHGCCLLELCPTGQSNVREETPRDSRGTSG